MYKVMIVDDEDIIVSGLVKVMPWAKYGCEVAATASDGLAAQAVLREKRPDILFTDICMPGADGLALLAAVRSEFPDMQVTILSGFPDFEYAQRAIGLGVVRYVLKPSKMHELEEALAVMVENLGGAPASGAVQSAENAQNFIIKKAVQYIEQHYAEKLTLPDVADKVYVSQWHLSKLIAKNTGQSFSRPAQRRSHRQSKGAAGRPSPQGLGSERRGGLCGCDAFFPHFQKNGEYERQRIPQ